MQDYMTIYLAGKITGDPYYRDKFREAAQELEAEGHIVLSPAILPNGFSYEAYLRLSSAMLDECEAVCLLPDWKESFGATYEYGRAVAQGKLLFGFEEWLCEKHEHRLAAHAG